MGVGVLKRPRSSGHELDFADEAIERLTLVKKFQGVGCSLAELKDILQDHDTHARTNREVIEWICQKMQEIEWRKDELDQMLGTLHRMLEYKLALAHDPQTANAL